MADKETVKVVLGKVSLEVSRMFHKFTEAFRGNIEFALKFLMTRSCSTRDIQSSGMKIDLVAEVEKTHIQTIYDMIDYFISKRRLLSRGDALEILVLQSGIEWINDSSIRISTLKSDTMIRLNEDRKLKKFCDLEISVYCKNSNAVNVYHVHKCVLAMESSHFRDILEDDTKLVQIENIVEPHLFGYILDFVYTGEMHFEASTSSNIYFLAKHLGVDKLIELCKDYFKVSRTVLEDVSMELTITKQMDVHNSDPDSEDNQLLPRGYTSSNDEPSSPNTGLTKKTVKESKKNYLTTDNPGERKHCCTTCGKLFFKSEHLRRHERTHSNDRPFNCDQCDKKFKTRDNLKRHALTHTEDRPFFCEICAKQFKDKSGLLVHQKSHRKAKLKCQHCDKTFTHRNRLTSHILMHTNPPSCKTCGKQFKHRTQLVRHEMIHTGDRPFSCESCGKQFIDMHSLKLHQKRHTGFDMHECSQCDKKFIDRYHLTRHMKMHTGEKPYMCDYCGKSFSRGDNCEIHKLSCSSKNLLPQTSRPTTERPVTKLKKSLVSQKKETSSIVNFIQDGNVDVASLNELNGGRYVKIAKK